jgi:hypothetical protein
MAHTISRVEVAARRLFRCPACGYEAEASVTGFGEGVAAGLGRGAGQVASDQAAAAAARDADAAVARVSCPRCGHRDARAVAAWWTRRLGALAALGALMIVGTFAGTAGASPATASTARWTGVGIVVVILIVLYLVRVRPRVRAHATDESAAAVERALGSFMDHARSCAACDLDRGEAGLCPVGRDLYRDKERAEQRGAVSARPRRSG